MTKDEIKDLQRDLNQFTGKYLEDVGPLLVDGDMGEATKKRIIMAKWYLGYGKAKRDASVYHNFRVKLRHPKGLRGSTGPLMVGIGAKRRVAQRRHARKVRAAAAHADGFGTFDGKVVARWMIPWLEKSRRAGWKGVVVSGVRTPAHSEALCRAMCGAPTCLGRCAGRSSNHNMLPSQGEPHGAVDVSDYINFAAIQKRIGSPLKNALPNDRVHFSTTGR